MKLAKKFHLSFYLLFLTFPFVTSAQNRAVNKFIGVIDVKNVGIFPYQLEYYNSNNLINGFTITNTNNKDETKANIKGFISEKGYIEFSELGILKTSIKSNVQIFCLVKTRLQFKKILGQEVLEGKFTGSDSKGNFCGSGTIKLIRETQEISELLNNIPAKEEIQVLVDPNTKTLLIDSINPIELNTSDFKIRIYDNGVVDNDEISVTYNNQILTDKMILDDKGKIFDLDIQKNMPNILEIKPLNEGFYPPNTANIEIRTQSRVKTFSYRASNNKTILLQFTLAQ